MSQQLLQSTEGADAHPREGAFRLDDGREADIRPLRPDDHALYREFGRHVTAEDHRLRFFGAGGGLSPRRAWALTHYDPAAARAYVAVAPGTGAMLGVGRVHLTEPGRGEFAVLVRSDLKGQGLGRRLMDHVLEGATELSVDTLFGLVLRENARMLALCRELGFIVAPLTGEPGTVEVRRVRSDGAGQWPVASASRVASNRNQVRRSVSSI